MIARVAIVWCGRKLGFSVVKESTSPLYLRSPRTLVCGPPPALPNIESISPLPNMLIACGFYGARAERFSNKCYCIRRILGAPISLSIGILGVAIALSGVVAGVDLAPLWPPIWIYAIEGDCVKTDVTLYFDVAAICDINSARDRLGRDACMLRKMAHLHGVGHGSLSPKFAYRSGGCGNGDMNSIKDEISQ